jgi:hypothetical protein
MGSYLHALRDNVPAPRTRLFKSERKYYQAKIVKVRNTLLHEAGSNLASDAEFLDLLAEMQKCVIRVAGL